MTESAWRDSFSVPLQELFNPLADQNQQEDALLASGSPSRRAAGPSVVSSCCHQARETASVFKMTLGLCLFVPVGL